MLRTLGCDLSGFCGFLGFGFGVFFGVLEATASLFPSSRTRDVSRALLVREREARLPAILDRGAPCQAGSVEDEEVELIEGSGGAGS